MKPPFPPTAEPAAAAPKRYAVLLAGPRLAPVPVPVVPAGPKREAGAALAGAGVGLGVGEGREREVPLPDGVELVPNLYTAPAVPLLSSAPLPAMATGSTGASPAGKPGVRMNRGRGLPSEEANGESDAAVAQREG